MLTEFHQKLIQTAEQIPPSKEQAARLVPLLDLTTLSGTETEDTIIALCQQAQTRLGRVAAVCVYPQWIRTAQQVLAEAKSAKVAVATVANFPAGTANWAQLRTELEFALSVGANEIDVVFPYEQYLNGDVRGPMALMQQCRDVIPSTTVFKVILETAEFTLREFFKPLNSVAHDLIHLQVDFLKTSTGKGRGGASIAAAVVLLDAIQQHDGQCGLKLSGGISEVDQALTYLQLATAMLGDEWVEAAHLRFGASRLLQQILQYVDAPVV